MLSPIKPLDEAQAEQAIKDAEKTPVPVVMPPNGAVAKAAATLTPNQGSRRIDTGVTPVPTREPNPNSPFKKVDAPAATTPPPTPAAESPAPMIATKSIYQDVVIELLLNCPAAIRDYTAQYEAEDRKYRAKLTDLSIDALGTPLFPGKKSDDPYRAASNDTERDLAIQQVCQTDEALIAVAQDREIALRCLRYEQNRFESAKLVAQLLATQPNK